MERWNLTSPFGAFFSLTIIIYMVHFSKYIKCKKKSIHNTFTVNERFSIYN